MDRVRLGRWEKQKVNDKVYYQCSECGNIESEPKDKCCLCKATMIGTVTEDNDNERVIQSL